MKAKDELAEIVDFLKDPAKFQKLGAARSRKRAPCWPDLPAPVRRCSAAAIAGEAGVPFFYISRLGLR